MAQVKYLMMQDEEHWCEDVYDILKQGHEDFYSFASEVMDNLIHPNPNLTEQEVMEELEWVWEEHTINHADAY